jgi:hypothetical protein
MDMFDQQRLARRLIDVKFDPQALMIEYRNSAVAKMYRIDALPGRNFYVELEKTSAVHQDGHSVCPLNFSSTQYYEGRADELKGILYIYANLDGRLKPSRTLTMDVSGKLVFFQKYDRKEQRFAVRFDYSTDDISGIVFEVERLRAKEEEARLAKIETEKLRAELEKVSDSNSLIHIEPGLEDELVPLTLDPDQLERPNVNDVLRAVNIYRE